MEEDCMPSMLAWEYIDHIASSIKLDMRIAGATLNNFVSARLGKTFKSPFLSQFNHCWGWVTTKESWILLRPNPETHSMGSLSYRNIQIEQVLKARFRGDERAKQYWSRIFTGLINKSFYHWDYSYMLNMLQLGLFFIAPPVNLVSNTGAGETSLNCKKATKNHFLSVVNDKSGKTAVAMNRDPDLDYCYDNFDRLNQRIVFSESKLSKSIDSLGRLFRTASAIRKA
jgi:hypothetical protein